MLFSVKEYKSETQNVSRTCRSIVSGVAARGVRMLVLLAMGLVLVLTSVDSASAQVNGVTVIDRKREYNVKAVSIYAFSRLTLWPQEAFSASDADFVIGVFGASRIQDPLLEVARKKKVGTRRFRVLQCKSAQEAQQCHLVFVSDTLDGETKLAVIQATEKLPIFVVGESQGLGAKGAVANFFITGTNVKFELNQEAAEAKGLRLNAKLLSLGKAVKANTASAPEKQIR